MRALIQRVSRASVAVDGVTTGAIDAGLLVLLGIAPDDTELTADQLAEKAVNLRIFEDGDGHMNRSLLDTAGALLCISQFTLYGDARRGRRPSFAGAAEPGIARTRYESFCAAIETAGVRCERGVFGAHMLVESVNDGPVTLMLDSVELGRPRRA
jgi:D-tyrosyl-tRNA(Tyr) deacylase